MSRRSRLESALLGELLLLVSAAPLAYFSTSLPRWLGLICLFLLLGGWTWRRYRTGCWLRRTPADLPLYFMVLVQLPLAVLVAPSSLRFEYSVPRALIIAWNFCLFVMLVVYAGRSKVTIWFASVLLVGVGFGLSIVALLGTQWVSKVPVLGLSLAALPRPLVGLFSGAESGFSPNQVAGALLCCFPLGIALALVLLRERRSSVGGWLMVVATGWIGCVLLLTQSRAGLLGATAAVIVMLAMASPWVRRVLVVTLLLVVVSSPLWFSASRDFVAAVQANDLSPVGSLASRTQIWISALTAIQEFPLSGMGLGTFRSLVWLLYPPFLIPPGMDIAHAHNLFLQQALDFGLPGLVALVSVFVVAIVQVSRLMRSPATRVLSWGFAGCLMAQIVYGQLDVVAMGSKPNFLMWWLLALIFASANWLCAPDTAQNPVEFK